MSPADEDEWRNSAPRSNARFDDRRPWGSDAFYSRPDKDMVSGTENRRWASSPTFASDPRVPRHRPIAQDAASTPYSRIRGAAQRYSQSGARDHIARSADDLISPPNTRHAFRREPATDYFNYDRDRYRRGTSSERYPRSGHHEYQRESSPSYGRGSSTWRDQRDESWARSSRHSASPRSQPIHTSPTLAARLLQTSETRSSNDAEFFKIVPKGPSRGLSTLNSIDSRVPEAINPADRARPHVFISADQLVPQHGTIKHLKNITRATCPLNVLVDAKGYYFTFDNSEMDGERLRACARKLDTCKLFGQYDLKTECFPVGSLAADRENSPVAARNQPVAAVTVQMHEPVRSLDDEMAPGEPVAPERHDTPNPQPLVAPLLLHAHKSYASLGSTRAVALSPVSQTFLNVDRDDSLSVRSATTTSSMSKTKRCHICRQRAEVEPLVECPTPSCRRRYHRHCYAGEIPADLNGWQCRRCTQKGLPQKRAAPMLDHSSPLCNASRRPSIAEIPHKRRCVDGAGDNQADAEHGASATEVDIRDRADSIHSAGASFALERSVTDAQTRPNEKSLPAAERANSQAAPDGPAQTDGSEENAANKSDAAHERLPSNDVAASVAQTPGTQPASIVAGSSSTSYGPADVPDTAIRATDLAGGENTGSRSGTLRMAPRAPQVLPCGICHSRMVPRTPAGGVPMCVGCKKAVKDKAVQEDLASNNADPIATGVEKVPLDTPMVDSPKPVDEKAGIQDASDLNQVPQAPVSQAPSVCGTACNPISIDDDEELETAFSPQSKAQSRESVSPRSKLSHVRRTHASDDSSEGSGRRPHRRTMLQGSPQLDAHKVSRAHSEERHNPGPPVEEIQAARPRAEHSAVSYSGLGTCRSRPKMTYLRLFGMALCAAPDHCLQPASVADWVSKNIPDYDLDIGIWAKSIKSAMAMNTTDTYGVKILSRRKWQPGDGGCEDSDWFTLLPGMEDHLEHWDPVNRRPIPPKVPINLSRNSQSARSSRVKQSARSPGVKRSGQTSQTDSGLQSEDDLDMEDAASTVTFATHEVVDITMRDSPPATATGEEQAMSRLADKTFAIVINDTAETLPEDWEYDAPSTATATEQDGYGLQRRAPRVQFQSNARVASADADTSTDMMDVDEDIEDYSTAQPRATNPTKRPQKRRAVEKLDMSATAPSPPLLHQILVDRAGKLEEIQQRPRRKDLFGKPAIHSSLGTTDQPLVFQASSRARTPGPELTNPANWANDGTSICKFSDVDEFLGLTENLVPALVNDELCFKRDADHGRRAKYLYRTGV